MKLSQSSLKMELWSMAPSQMKLWEHVTHAYDPFGALQWALLASLIITSLRVLPWASLASLVLSPLRALSRVSHASFFLEHFHGHLFPPVFFPLRARPRVLLDSLVLFPQGDIPRASLASLMLICFLLLEHFYGCCSPLSCSFLLENFHRFCLSLCCSLLLGHFNRLLAYLVLTSVRALPRVSLTSLVLTAIIGGTVINVGGWCDSGIQWLLAWVGSSGLDVIVVWGHSCGLKAKAESWTYAFAMVTLRWTVILDCVSYCDILGWKQEVVANGWLL